MKWLLRFVLFFLFVSGLIYLTQSNLAAAEKNLMYPSLNLKLYWLSCAFFILFCFARIQQKFFIALLLIVPALYLNSLALKPTHEVDRLFYSELSRIENQYLTTSITDKIELCDHVKSIYVNLKPAMLKVLEKVCSNQILELSQGSSWARNKAFNWAYSEYVRKPDQYQVIALACMYAETDQKDFGLQLTEKHKLSDLQDVIQKQGRCKIFSSRQIASVER